VGGHACAQHLPPGLGADSFTAGAASAGPLPGKSRWTIAPAAFSGTHLMAHLSFQSLPVPPVLSVFMWHLFVSVLCCSQQPRPHAPTRAPRGYEGLLRTCRCSIGSCASRALPA
jgi:hypothetical protein